ncbi:hypothetical protein ACSSS7_004327 [Eimeria intestinalis]
MGGSQSKAPLAVTELGGTSGGPGYAATGTERRESAASPTPHSESPSAHMFVACPSCGDRSSSCSCWWISQPSGIGRFTFPGTMEEGLRNENYAAFLSETAAYFSSTTATRAAATAAAAAAAAEREAAAAVAERAAAAAAERAAAAAADEFYDCVGASSFASQACSATAETVWRREAQEAKAARRAAKKAAKRKCETAQPSWGGPLWPLFDVRLRPRPKDPSGVRPPSASVLLVEDPQTRKLQRERAAEYVLAAMENCLHDHHMLRINYSPKFADSAFEYRRADPRESEPPHDETGLAAASAAVEKAAKGLAELVARERVASDRRRRHRTRRRHEGGDDPVQAARAVAAAAAAEGARAEAAALKTAIAAQRRELMRACFREQAERVGTAVRKAAIAAAAAAAAAETAALEAPRVAAALNRVFRRSLELPEVAWRSLGEGAAAAPAAAAAGDKAASVCGCPLPYHPSAPVFSSTFVWGEGGSTWAPTSANARPSSLPGQQQQLQQQQKQLQQQQKQLQQQPKAAAATAEAAAATSECSSSGGERVGPSSLLLLVVVLLLLQASKHRRSNRRRSGGVLAKSGGSAAAQEGSLMACKERDFCGFTARLLEAYAWDTVMSEQKQETTRSEVCLLDMSLTLDVALQNPCNRRDSCESPQQQEPQKRMDNDQEEPQLTWGSPPPESDSLPAKVADPLEDFYRVFLSRSKTSKRSKKEKRHAQQQQQKLQQRKQQELVELSHKQQKIEALAERPAVCCCDARKVEQRLRSRVENWVRASTVPRFMVPITGPLPVWAEPGVHVIIVPSCCRSNSSNSSSSSSSPHAFPPSCCSVKDTEAPPLDDAETHSSQRGTAAAVAAADLESKEAPVAHVCTVAGLEQLSYSSAGFERFLLHLEPVQQQQEQQQQQQQEQQKEQQQLLLQLTEEQQQRLLQEEQQQQLQPKREQQQQALREKQQQQLQMRDEQQEQLLQEEQQQPLQQGQQQQPRQTEQQQQHQEQQQQQQQQQEEQEQQEEEEHQHEAVEEQQQQDEVEEQEEQQQEQQQDQQQQLLQEEQQQRQEQQQQEQQQHEQQQQQEEQQRQHGQSRVDAAGEQALFSALLDSPRVREMTRLAGCSGVLPLSLQHILLLLLPSTTAEQLRDLLVGRMVMVLGTDFSQGHRGRVAAVDPKSGSSLLRMEGETEIIPIGCSNAYLCDPPLPAAASDEPQLSVNSSSY